MRPEVNVLGLTFWSIGFNDAEANPDARNYLMVRRRAGDWNTHEILYAGEASNLATRFNNGHERLNDALGWGATHLLVGPPIWNDERRVALETVLRYEFSPPVNRQTRPTLLAAWTAATTCGLKSKADSYWSRLSLPPVVPLPRRAGLGALAQALSDEKAYSDPLPPLLPTRGLGALSQAFWAEKAYEDGPSYRLGLSAAEAYGDFLPDPWRKK